LTTARRFLAGVRRRWRNSFEENSSRRFDGFRPGKEDELANLPTDRAYTKEHEWIKIEGKLATVGITDYAQSSLGDIVYVEMPKPGAALEQSKPMGVVESVKAVSDIYAPISGKAVEVNGDVENDPAIVNNDPYGAGWLVKIELSNGAEAKSLLDAAAYQLVIDALK
jgi:glycine cleavage system H protein